MGGNKGHKQNCSRLGDMAPGGEARISTRPFALYLMAWLGGGGANNEGRGR